MKFNVVVTSHFTKADGEGKPMQYLELKARGDRRSGFRVYHVPCGELALPIGTKLKLLVKAGQAVRLEVR